MSGGPSRTGVRKGLHHEAPPGKAPAGKSSVDPNPWARGDGDNTFLIAFLHDPGMLDACRGTLVGLPSPVRTQEA